MYRFLVALIPVGAHNMFRSECAPTSAFTDTGWQAAGLFEPQEAFSTSLRSSGYTDWRISDADSDTRFLFFIYLRLFLG